MGIDENVAYHTVLLQYLNKKEGVEKFKLWSKMEKGEVLEKATKLKIYDEKLRKFFQEILSLVGVQVVLTLETS